MHYRFSNTPDACFILNFDVCCSQRVRRRRAGSEFGVLHRPVGLQQRLQARGGRDVLRRAKWTKGSFRGSYAGQEATVVRTEGGGGRKQRSSARP